MTDTPPISLNNLEKAFKSHRVLKGISFALEPGEVFGLIGLNGAGKTTMIKIILDLMKPDAGEAALLGVCASNVVSRQGLSYLPEKFHPSKYLKGHEYLELSLSFYGKSYDKEEGRKQAETLDLLPDALDRLVGSYSKGMGQKLGLLGAFMVDTPLMILDEPMSGLDPKARILLKNKILEAKKAGKTIFFSSHILADIDEICDRIGVLHNGDMIYLGVPSQFKKEQAHEGLEAAFLHAISQKKEAA